MQKKKKSGSNIYEGIVVYIQGQIKDVNRKNDTREMCAHFTCAANTKMCSLVLILLQTS